MVQGSNTYLGTTKDGFKVYDRVDSHLHTEGGLNKELLRKALKWMYANNSAFKKRKSVLINQLGLVIVCL